jgi:hypothetical protein
MASDTEVMLDITAKCRRLLSLLEDPYPGLSTWQELRTHAARELRDALADVLDEPDPEQITPRAVVEAVRNSYQRGWEAGRRAERGETL